MKRNNLSVVRLFYVLCLLLTGPFLFAAAAAGEDDDPIEKYKELSTNKLHQTYMTSEESLGNAVGNHNEAVRKVEKVREDIDENKASIDQTTVNSLINLIRIAGASFATYISGGTATAVVISAGSVTVGSQVIISAEKVELWEKGEDLENLLDIASNVAEAHSDIYSEAKHERDDLRTAYDDRFNEDGTPKDPNDPHGTRVDPPKVARDLSEVDYPCVNACGSRFKSYSNAQDLHKKQCASASAPVPGCGKSYYDCPSKPDGGHDVLTCANFSSPGGTYTSSDSVMCGVSFRECSPSGCSATVTHPHPSGTHSAASPEKKRFRDKKQKEGAENICPECKKPHSTSGSGSGSGS